MNKVEEIKRPLKKGEKFLVPCIVKQDEFYTYINPVINHPHHDKENGQDYIHYHTDTRFVKFNEDGTIKREHRSHYFCNTFRPILGKDGDLRYIVLPVINEDFTAITDVNLISKSKIRHKCSKNKCPHRGYDLSQVKEVNGFKKCPLHGLIIKIY